MSLYHALETVIVPLVVLGCAVSVASRYAPRTRERVKAALAASLGGAAATGWRAALVRRLAPTMAQGCASGCDDGGCGTCESNTAGAAGASGAPAVPKEQVVRVVRKR